MSWPPELIGVDEPIDDDGDRRRELLLDDLPHRLREPARGVEQDHDRVEAVLPGPVDLVVQVALRRRVDLGLEVDGEDARSRRGGAREGERCENGRQDDASHEVKIA